MRLQLSHQSKFGKEKKSNYITNYVSESNLSHMFTLVKPNLSLIISVSHR